MACGSWWAEVEEVFADRQMEVEEITTRGEWVVMHRRGALAPDG